MKVPARIYSFGAVALLATVSFFLSEKPYYNWDIFPYMAVVMDRPEVPLDSTINRVYREVEFAIPPRDYAVLASKHPELRNDPQEFRHILKYYTIKPGYILVIRLLKFLGFDLVKATFLPSVVSYFLLGALLLWWLPKLLTPPFGQVIALLTCAIPFMVDTARYSSPDMLCALIFLAGLYLLADAYIIAGLLVCGLSVVVRPDMIIQYLFVILALYLSKKTNLRVATVFSLCGALVVYLIIGFPGILGEFLFTNPSNSPSIEGNAQLSHYFSGLVNGLSSIVRSRAAIFLLLGPVVLYLRTRNEQSVSSDFWSLMVVACWTTFMLRYLLHPAIEDRFLITSYLVMIIALCDTINIRRARLKRVQEF